MWSFLWGSKTIRHLVGFQALQCRFTAAIDKDSHGPRTAFCDLLKETLNPHSLCLLYSTTSTPWLHILNQMSKISLCPHRSIRFLFPQRLTENLYLKKKKKNVRVC